MKYLPVSPLYFYLPSLLENFPYPAIPAPILSAISHPVRPILDPRKKGKELRNFKPCLINLCPLLFRTALKSHSGWQKTKNLVLASKWASIYTKRFGTYDSKWYIQVCKTNMSWLAFDLQLWDILIKSMAQQKKNTKPRSQHTFYVVWRSSTLIHKEIQRCATTITV